jgi:hypothetical protein
MIKETIKNPMDLVPIDPIAILNGLPSVKCPRDYSTKFSDLLKKNPETYRGKEEEIVNKSKDILSQLDNKMAQDKDNGYFYLSINDVLIGLAEMNNDLAWEFINSRRFVSYRFNESIETQMSKKAESLLNNRPTKQSVALPKA